MNTIKLLMTFLSVIAFSGIYGASFEQEFYRRLDRMNNPTTPQYIQNWQGFLGGRYFYRRRIFFGKDELGKPIYQSIGEHAQENPEFGRVALAIFHPAAWYKLRSSDTFEVVGTFSDKDARTKVIKSMTPGWFEDVHKARGGMWCPEQNAIIGGTQDPEICDRFAQYLKEEKEKNQFGQSSVKKV